jgi:hypothetical protein
MKDITLALSATATEEGFDILAISEGEAKGHGIYFSEQVLLDAVGMYDGQPVFIDHPQPGGKQSIRNLAGTLHGAMWNESERGIQLKLRPSGPSKQVLLDIQQAAKENPAIMAAIGFSTVLNVQLNSKSHVTKIVRVKSVDVVIEPARGGKFLQSLSDEENTTMNEETTAQSPQALQLEANRSAAAELLGETTRLQAMDAALAESQAVLVAQCEHLLTSGLTTSKLPPVVQGRIRKSFEGRAFKAVELQSAISEAREEVTALTAGSSISGPARFSNMQTSADQFELAMLDLFDVERDADKKNVKVARLSGIREAYTLATGDRDFIGGYFPEFALDAASFPVIIKNALNKRLAQAWAKYGAAGYDWWNKIVTVEHFDNIKQVDWAILGTIATLPTVAESGAYTQLAIGDNGETSDWTKYGGYVALTLEDIINDNIRAFKRLPDEAAMGGMRNISEKVAAIFTSASGAGPTLSDTGALFNATAQTTAGGHKNLLTTALGTDYTAWEAAAAAMYDQPMHVKNSAGVYGTGKKQAVDPKFCLVPRPLRGAANNLFVTRMSSVSNVHSENLYYGEVQPITVPEFTDATDWAAVADPNIVPGIMLGEIFGLMPQVVVAGKETDSAMFSNDESRLKIRQFVTVGVGNWRALHKNNVA